ncbi:MAG TPA: TolC family protein [Candidatus Acidoferrales bacterium]|jgi:multidrug efflux system outer membrane protein|nr:TolC family protein [Candidatus Acidoferrales bacterium]
MSFKMNLQRIAARAALAATIAASGFAANTRAQDAQVLTMHQAIALALQNSRDLKLARVDYNVALNEAGVDRAAFRPNLYTGAGLAYTYGFPSLPGGEAPSVFQLDYQQTLFNPLLKGQQKAAEDRAKNQKIEMDRVRDDVIVRAASEYLELAEVQHSLELMHTERASAEKILQALQERLSANQELPIDVTRSQLALARIQERTIKLEDREETLEAEIRDLTGISETQSIEAQQDEPSFGVDQSEADMENLALQSDRSVAEAENEREARQHILRGAHLSYFPTIDIVGQYAILSKFNNYGEFYNKFERNNLNIGVQVTIPIFAAKTSANVALAKSQLDEAELLLGNKRQQVRLDVQQKARSVRELDASREVARLDLQLAQETLQQVQAKFDQSNATLQDIEQARLDESDKWLAFLDADFARQQAQLSLLQATGQLAKVFQ